MGEDTFSQEYDDAYGFRPSGTFGIQNNSVPSCGDIVFTSFITGGAIEMILTDFTVTRGNLFEQVEMVFDDLVAIILRIYKGKFLVHFEYTFTNGDEL